MKRIEINTKGENPEGIDESSIEGQSQVDQASRELPEMEADLSKSVVEEQLVTEAEEWKDKYLRLYADLENTKKRLAKKLEIQLEEETSAVLLDMLPVADNLELISAYAKESGDKELERGLEITLEAFREAMGKHGLSSIDARGKLFNPEYHEAIGAVPAPQFEEGTILKVEQTGYLFDGKVLRPAKVVIASR